MGIHSIHRINQNKTEILAKLLFNTTTRKLKEAIRIHRSGSTQELTTINTGIHISNIWDNII